MHDNIAISGRAGGDPTFSTTGKGLHVASFSIATDYLRRDANGQFDRENKETNWYRVVTFGQLAANVAATVRKGRTVIVAGRLHIVAWENDDGRKGTKVEIIAESVGLDLRWADAPNPPAPATAPPVRQQDEDVSDAVDARAGGEGTRPPASDDAWINAGATRAAVMADAETPF